MHHSPHTHKKKYNLRDALHCVHSSGIGGRHWQSRDEGAATHAHIERGISRNDAVVAVAEGDRELPQRARVRLFFCALHDCVLGISPFTSCAGVKNDLEYCINRGAEETEVH